MAGAIQLVQHYAGEALRLTLAQEKKEDPDLETAEKFGKWLRLKHGGKTVGLTAIEQNAVPTGVRKAETAHLMLAILQDRGWVVRIPGADLGNGRRRHDTWKVVLPPAD